MLPLVSSACFTNSLEGSGLGEHLSISSSEEPPEVRSPHLVDLP